MDDIEINLDTAKPQPTKSAKQSSNPQDIPGKIGDESLGSEGLFSQFDFRRSAHPLACLSHIIFKTLAIVM